MEHYYPYHNIYGNTLTEIKESSILDNRLKIANKSDKNRQTYTKFHNNKTFRKK